MILQGFGLPARWQARDQFVILETGFDQGQQFLQTWSQWRNDAGRCRHLFFVAIDKQPPPRAQLEQHLQPLTRDKQRLLDAWPVHMPGLHALSLDDESGQVTLLLCHGDVADVMPSLVMQVDAVYLHADRVDDGLVSRLGRLAAPGCTVAASHAGINTQAALTQAGFVVTTPADAGGSTDTLLARFEPRHTPALPPGGYRPAPPLADRHALIIGAGLAGCVATWALCRAGWRVTLLDRQAQPAQEASGNPGGMFHAIVHGEDGIHARAHRAAALALVHAVQPWIDDGLLAGQLQGLLRLDPKTTHAEAQALISKLALPDDYVQWLDQADAADVAGMPVNSGGWLFKQAGWLHPAGLARALLDEAQTWAQRHDQSLTLKFGQAVDCMARSDDGWAAWGAGDDSSPAKPLAQAPHLVVTSANGVNHLLQSLPADQAVPEQLLTAIRGQITALSLDSTQQYARAPHLPVAGSGYALTLPDGRLLCGATTQHHDDCPDVRLKDHTYNLGQAWKLGAIQAESNEQAESLIQTLAQDPTTWGRTGWRASTPDRLPLVGALPLSAERLAKLTQTSPHGGKLRLDQTRMIHRERDVHGGLFILSGLGSRGITWSVLAGQLLAHWMAGTPCPVEADLRDALDPARFVARSHSKAAK